MYSVLKVEKTRVQRAGVTCSSHTASGLGRESSPCTDVVSLMGSKAHETFECLSSFLYSRAKGNTLNC